MKPKSKALAVKPLLRRLKAWVRPRSSSSLLPGPGMNSVASHSAKTSSRTMRGGHVPAPATPNIKLEALYLFSGEPRDNDLSMEIVRVGHSMGLQIEVTEN